ncbi:hypothetical protein [Flindersiella endophytica]
MSGQSGASSTGQIKSTLSPLPGPPAKLRRGYLWAIILVGVAYLGALALVGFDMLAIPYVDPVRSGSWFLVFVLMLITPFALLLAVLSCGVVAILRKTVAGQWPGILQALPAVLIVFGIVALVAKLLFADDPSTPY